VLSEHDAGDLPYLSDPDPEPEPKTVADGDDEEDDAPVWERHRKEADLE
jgi:hypothetical protein